MLIEQNASIVVLQSALKAHFRAHLYFNPLGPKITCTLTLWVLKLLVL